MARKKTTSASCLVAALFFGLISFIGNIGGCGRETTSTSKPLRSSKESDSIRSQISEERAHRLAVELAPTLEPSASEALPAPQINHQIAPADALPSATTATDPFKGDPKLAASVLFPTPSRKWTSQDGRAVLGIVTKFDPTTGAASLRTAAGETFDGFSAERFSEADREYLYAAADGRLVGKVVGVADGDTLTLLVGGNTQFKIRLESIDTPEIGQEYGNNAKAELSRLVYGKEIDVSVSGLDKYKRFLGWVTGPEGQNINLALVAAGLAWNYVEYSKSTELAAAEKAARDAKRGLWNDWKPMAPWEWRDLQRENAARKAAQPIVATPFSSDGRSAASPTEPAPATTLSSGYWINSSSGKRHNKSCRWYGNTKNGRACGPNDGSPCGICGG